MWPKYIAVRNNSLYSICFIQRVLYYTPHFHLLALLVQLPVAVLINKDFLISDVDKELFLSLLPLNAK